MFDGPTLTALAGRKRVLIERAEALRAALGGMVVVQEARLSQVAAGWQVGSRVLRKAAPWLVLAAPVAGFLVGRHREWLFRAADRIVRFWPVARPLYELYREMQSKKS